ncbi:MAG: preprotein translocase subunit SecE [Candidatus Aminicenantes bacterium RBG_13_62_12]|nr:MAG: preprotein translocase subunit SecE [Candidatus Aminicenantes bacterium RBG_13_62_12]
MSEGKKVWYKRFFPFLKDVRAELKKVTWPSRKETVNTTIVVIISVFFFGFYLFFMDVIFSRVVDLIKFIKR